MNPIIFCGIPWNISTQEMYIGLSGNSTKLLILKKIVGE
jgi:hypothetical protein